MVNARCDDEVRDLTASLFGGRRVVTEGRWWDAIVWFFGFFVAFG